MILIVFVDIFVQLLGSWNLELHDNHLFFFSFLAKAFFFPPYSKEEVKC